MGNQRLDHLLSKETASSEAIGENPVARLDQSKATPQTSYCFLEHPLEEILRSLKTDSWKFKRITTHIRDRRPQGRLSEVKVSC